jgi:hypothetical protein
VSVFCAEGSEVSVKSIKVRPLPVEGSSATTPARTSAATPAVTSAAIPSATPAKTSPAMPAQSHASLAAVLPGSKWLWYGRKDNVLEFGQDGKIVFDDWTKKGLVTTWEVTGLNEVRLSITSGRNKDLTATLKFSDDRAWFAGMDFDQKHAISRSPRTGGGN